MIVTLLTDKAIESALGKDIIIEPFNRKKSLTAVGYDFSVGEFVFSLEKGLLKPTNGKYLVEAKNTIQILTRESLWVSGRIAGTFHSKVSLVSKGFSHISTTLDPNWYGPLLITMRNNRDKAIELDVHQGFVTLVFFRVLKPTSTPSAKPAFRTDILFGHNAKLGTYLEERTQVYVEKVSQLVNNPAVLKEFKDKVEAANMPMMAKIADSVRFGGLRSKAVTLLGVSIFTLPPILGILVLFNWGQIKGIFPTVPGDAIMTMFIAIAGGLGGALLLLYNRLK